MTDVIPGGGRWVFDHLAENGVRTVLPVAGWRASEDDLLPLPKPPDETWILRPRMPDDERLIRVTALNMQPKPDNQNDPNAWRHLHP
jgi:hypothetical protein